MSNVILFLPRRPAPKPDSVLVLVAMFLDEAEARRHALFRAACDYTLQCTVPIEDQNGRVRCWVGSETAVRNYGGRICGHDEAWIRKKLEELRSKQATHPVSRLDELQLAAHAAEIEVQELREQLDAALAASEVQP